MAGRAAGAPSVLRGQSEHVRNHIRGDRCGRAPLVPARAPDTLAYAWAKQASRRPRPSLLSLVRSGSVSGLRRRQASGVQPESPDHNFSLSRADPA